MSKRKEKGKKSKPTARQVNYKVICGECWKSLDPDGHAMNWKFARVKEACEHCLEDDPNHFRISVPAGITVIL